MDIYDQIKLNSNTRGKTIVEDLIGDEIISELNKLGPELFCLRAEIKSRSLENIKKKYEIHQNKKTKIYEYKIKQIPQLKEESKDRTNDFELKILEKFEKIESEITKLKIKVETIQSAEKNKVKIEKIESFSEYFPNISRDTTFRVNSSLYFQFMEILQKKLLKKNLIINQLIFEFVKKQEDLDQENEDVQHDVKEN